MKQIRNRVAGLDIHRDTVVACCRIQGPGDIEMSKETFPTTQGGLLNLAAFLHETGVTTVAMEATGVYWKTVYYALEGLTNELWLCNAEHVKNVPGRKSDLADAEWLADVAAHGMVRPSLVPPPEIRELRDMTRYRKSQVDTRSKEIQQLEKYSRMPASSSLRSLLWYGVLHRGRSSRLLLRESEILRFLPRWPRAGYVQRSHNWKKRWPEGSTPITPGCVVRLSTISAF